MANKFSSGRHSVAMCDRCGQRFKLVKLKKEIIKTKQYNLMVCQECWDPDHPQLQLGMYPVSDPQAVRNPRVDTTYYSAQGGSRLIQWGWNPVGGASSYDIGLTPNNLVATTSVGSVTIAVT